MRALMISAALLAAPAAFAQTDVQPSRPDDPPPAATASFDQRESWCEQYTAWFIASTPPQATIAQAAPSDVNVSHEYEVEFNSCKLDPREYERQTHAEAELNPEPSAG